MEDSVGEQRAKRCRAVHSGSDFGRYRFTRAFQLCFFINSILAQTKRF